MRIEVTNVSQGPLLCSKKINLELTKDEDIVEICLRVDTNNSLWMTINPVISDDKNDFIFIRKLPSFKLKDYQNRNIIAWIGENADNLIKISKEGYTNCHV